MRAPFAGSKPEQHILRRIEARTNAGPNQRAGFAGAREAAYSDPGNRRAWFHTAAGSAGETHAAVRTAVAWGIIARADGVPAVALLDRILPMLWKLTRG